MAATHSPTGTVRPAIALAVLVLLSLIVAVATAANKDNPNPDALWSGGTNGAAKFAAGDGGRLLGLDRFDRVRALAVDPRRGDAWVAGASGLHRLNPDGESRWSVGYAELIEPGRHRGHGDDNDRDEGDRGRRPGHAGDHGGARRNAGDARFGGSGPGLGLGRLGGDHPARLRLIAGPADGSVWLIARRGIVRVGPEGQRRARIDLRLPVRAAAFDTKRERLWLATPRRVAAHDATGERVVELDRVHAPLVQAMAYAPATDRLWTTAPWAVRGFDAGSGRPAARRFAWGARDLAADGEGGLWVRGVLGVTRYDAAGNRRFTLRRPIHRGRVIDMAANPADRSVWLAGRRMLVHVRADGAVDARKRLRRRGVPGRVATLGLFADITAPQLTLNAPAAGALRADARPTLALEYTDQGSGVDPASVELTANGVRVVVDCTATEAGADCVPKSDLAQGTNVLELTVADHAGNVSEAVERTITVDTIPPEITFTGGLQPGFITNEPEAGIAGELNEPATVTVDGTTVVEHSEQFDHSVTLSEGTNAFAITATDRAGNTRERTLAGTLDTQPPSAPDTDAIDVELADGEATVSGGAGSVEAGATVSVTNARTGETVRVIADADGAFSADIAAEPGDELTIVASDAAGNASDGVTVGGGNRAPTIEAIADRSVAPGNRASIAISANDPDGDPVSIRIRPTPLPDNAAFDPGTGEFAFSPDLAQAGQRFQFRAVATDGSDAITESFVVTVSEPDADAPTAVTGLLLDANAAENGRTVPIVGATVTLASSGVAVTTGDDGRFELSGIPGGERVLVVDNAEAEPAPDGSAYASFSKEMTLFRGVTKRIGRPLYLPRINMGSRTKVEPGEKTVVENETLDITLEVAADSAENQDGSAFTGELSVSRVPRAFTPQELPDRLDPAMLVTIQPAGTQFTQPAPISFPNRSDLAPGSEVDIWSLDPENGRFVRTGTGEVTADGERIETVAGGIRAADWHAAISPAAQPGGETDEGQSPHDPGNDCGGGGGQAKDTRNAGSSVSSRSGCLQTRIELPAHTSHGANRAPALVYDSGRASPQPVIPIDTTILRQGAVPKTFSYELSVGSVQRGDEKFIDTSGLSESRSEPLRAAASFDARGLPTGVYDYRVRQTNNYQRSSVSTSVDGELPLVNGTDNAAGAGWSIEGVSRLHEIDGGRALIENGDGGHTVYGPAGKLPQVSTNGADIEVIVPPRTVRRDAPEGELKLFAERFDFILPEDVTVEATDAKRFDSRDDFDPDTIPAGTPVNSYFIHQPPDSRRQTTTIEFSQPVLGITGSDMFGEYKHESTRVLGVDETLYGRTNVSDENIAFNTSDEEWFEISDDRRRVTVRTGSSCCADNARIITEGTAGPQNDSFVKPEGAAASLARQDDGSFVREFPNGRKVHFNADGLQTRTVDPNGNETTYSYDSRERLTTITDPAGRVTRFAYSGDQLASITDPTGRITRFAHDAEGNLTRVTFPDGATREYAYDDHLLVRQTDARGNTVRREYGPAGRLRRVTFRDGSTATMQDAATVGLPAPGEATADNPAPVTRPRDVQATYTDGEGRTRTVDTGPFGQAERITNAAGLTTRIERDEDGNPVRTERPNGAVIEREFDADDNLVLLRDTTVGGETAFTYTDAFDRLASITDSRGATTNFAYDERGNLVQASSPEGRTTTFTRRDDGQVATRTDVFGTENRFSYDAHGNVVERSRGPSGSARTTTIDRTQEGYVAAVTDPVGRTTAFAYDERGRVTRQTLPGGREVSFDYDANGNLVALGPPGQPTHRFEYTAMDDESAYDPPDAGPIADRTERAYNNARQLDAIHRPDGTTIDYRYGDGGNLVGVDTPTVGLALSYDRDLLTERRWSGAVSGRVAPTVDSERRVTERRVNGAHAIDFGYDADGLRTRAGALTLTRAPEHGRVTATTLDTVSDSRGYNAFGELASRTADAGSDTAYDVAYTRDDAGRLVEETSTVAGETTTYRYAYDEAGRLAEVRADGTVVHSYDYGPNGNRLEHTGPGGTTTAEFDAQDRLTRHGDTTYAYTAAGELASKTGPAGTTTYDYDALGNLRGVELADGTAIDYVIDGRNRRVGKKVDGQLEKAWLYKDGLNPVAQLDGQGRVTHRFVYADKANVPAYMVRIDPATGAETTYRIISDHLGSVRLVINADTGAIAQRLDYSPFGEVITDTNPGFQPFGFAGGLYDADTGLVRFGARDYDPQTGRWTAKDPIGFAGGTTNLYGYVVNDPINLLDPLGLADLAAAEVSLGAQVGFSGRAGPVGVSGVVNAGSIDQSTASSKARAVQEFGVSCTFSGSVAVDQARCHRHTGTASR